MNQTQRISLNTAYTVVGAIFRTSGVRDWEDKSQDVMVELLEHLDEAHTVDEALAVNGAARILSARAEPLLCKNCGTQVPDSSFFHTAFTISDMQMDGAGTEEIDEELGFYTVTTPVTAEVDPELQPA